MEINYSCPNCNGLGIKEGCPICDTVAKAFVQVIPERSDLFPTLQYVPEGYRGIIWNSEELKNSYLELRGSVEFETYIRALDDLVLKVQQGNLPTKNVLITSSVGMAKTTLAYYTMQIANSFGHKICPLFDNLQYRRLCVLSSDARAYRNFSKTIDVSLEMIESADLVFMTIDALGVMDAHRDIISLINKRTRNGKYSIILSTYNVNQITSLDFNKELETYLSLQKNNPRLIRLLQCVVR